MMTDIEAKIAEWRTEMAGALAGRDEDVAELESHLRDHYATLVRRGATPEAAFAESVKRLGEVHGIAREFERVRSPWWPRSWALRGVLAMWVAGVAAMGILIPREFSKTMTPLLVAHVGSITVGYLSVFCTGVAGCVALLKAWRRPLGARERRELRDLIFRLTCVSCVTVPIGVALGMVWSAQHRGAAWSWERVEVGAFFVLVSAVLLLVVQLRIRVSDYFRFVVAVLGGTAVAFGMVGARAVTPAVPIAWLGLAFAASQIAVVVLSGSRRKGNAVRE